MYELSYITHPESPTRSYMGAFGPWGFVTYGFCSPWLTWAEYTLANEWRQCIEACKFTCSQRGWRSREMPINTLIQYRAGKGSKLCSADVPSLVQLPNIDWYWTDWCYHSRRRNDAPLALRGPLPWRRSFISFLHIWVLIAGSNR